MRPCFQSCDYKYPGEKTHDFNRGMIAVIRLDRNRDRTALCGVLGTGGLGTEWSELHSGHTNEPKTVLRKLVSSISIALISEFPSLKIITCSRLRVTAV